MATDSTSTHADTTNASHRSVSETPSEGSDSSEDSDSSEENLANDFQDEATARINNVKDGNKKQNAPKSWTRSSDKVPWRPFVKHSRDGQWSLHELGKKWILERLDGYANIKAPEGVDKKEGKKRLRKHQNDWKEALDKEYMALWPRFKYKEVIGPHGNKEALEKAKKRVQSYINNQLTSKETSKRASADILDLLFHKLKQSSPQNLWAGSDPTYEALEHAGLARKGIDIHGPRGEVFPAQMQLRTELFNALPGSVRDHWKSKAKAAKAAEPSRDEIYKSIPKLFAMLGDAIVAKLGWSVMVIMGGEGKPGSAAMYSEEWHSSIAEDPLKFMSTNNWKAIDQGFRASVAKLQGGRAVNVKDVLTLNPYKRDEYVPKRVQRLADALQFDEHGTVISSVSARRTALAQYLNAAYANIPTSKGRARSNKAKVPWNILYRGDGNLEDWVESKRLPRIDFPLKDPDGMPVRDLDVMTAWILKGDAGDLDPSEKFQWKNQRHPDEVIRPIAGSRKSSQKSRLDAKQDEEEIFNLDDVSFSSVETDNVLRPHKVTAENSRKGPPVTATGGNKSVHSQKQNREQKISPNHPGHSVPKTKIKAGARPKSNRSESIDDSESDADADADDSEDEGFLGNAHVVFKGGAAKILEDPTEWLRGFAARESILEWEREDAGNSGSSAVNSARFLEATERSPNIILRQVLDVTRPPGPKCSERQEDFYNALFDLQGTIPNFTDYTLGHARNSILESLTNRLRSALAAIKEYPADKEGSLLRLGGNTGVFSLLRIAEFTRRVACADDEYNLAEENNTLLDDLEWVLAREMWRRWAYSTLRATQRSGTGNLLPWWKIYMEAVMRDNASTTEWWVIKWRSGSQPLLVDRVAKDAFLRTRGVTPPDMLLTMSDEPWTSPPFLDGMKKWVSEMTEGVFSQGCVVEKFLYVYGMYKCAGVGRQGREKWCLEGRRDLQRWLEAEIEHRQGHLILDRRALITQSGKSFRAATTAIPEEHQHMTKSNVIKRTIPRPVYAGAGVTHAHEPNTGPLKRAQSAASGGSEAQVAMGLHIEPEEEEELNHRENSKGEQHDTEAMGIHQRSIASNPTLENSKRKQDVYRYQEGASNFHEEAQDIGRTLKRSKASHLSTPKINSAEVGGPRALRGKKRVLDTEIVDDSDVPMKKSRTDKASEPDKPESTDNVKLKAPNHKLRSRVKVDVPSSTKAPVTLPRRSQRTAGVRAGKASPRKPQTARKTSRR